ncbi:MAG: peptidase M23 [Bacteroidota bacterium]|nr:peptidase M23 [Bacteroidota bacterium]
MKKIVLTLAAFVLITGTIFTACNTPSEKVENAEINAQKANDDLNTAKEEYANEVAEYRQEIADKIEANEKSIAEFKVKTENQKKEAKADYQKKITELEEKNSAMKMKMNDYKETSKDEWKKFKTEFEHDMTELGIAFANLSVNSTK